MCILPPSPVELSPNHQNEEENVTQIQRGNSSNNEKMDEDENEELIVGIDNNGKEQQENPTKETVDGN